MLATTAPSEEPIEIKKRRDEFIKELSETAKYHRIRGKFDASLHQFLVILAALGGFGALTAGLLWPNKGWIAGTIGAVPSLAAVLSLQLHCVKATNWHNRVANEMESLRHRLQFEGDDIVSVAKDLRAINAKLTAQWEAITTADPLGDWPTKPTTSSDQAHL